LGGTSEGRILAQKLAGDARFVTLLSLAGRTRTLQLPSTPHRVGGFGGADGLAAFLQREGITALVDTTHPFAAQISANAVKAAQITGTPLVRHARSAWRAEPGDRWLEVNDMAAAARALGAVPKRVFLSIGRLEIAAFHSAPEHDYLVRAVDSFDPGLPHARLVTARGPFEFAAERELLERERIEIVVSKNSGTTATYAKIAAARELQLPVIMVKQPQLPAADERGSLEEIVLWLEQRWHQDTSAMRRGE
jgi:precorrin-6A/cobalt-precorrin-6A reductase